MITPDPHTQTARPPTPACGAQGPRARCQSPHLRAYPSWSCMLISVGLVLISTTVQSMVAAANQLAAQVRLAPSLMMSFSSLMQFPVEERRLAQCFLSCCCHSTLGQDRLPSPASHQRAPLASPRDCPGLAHLVVQQSTLPPTCPVVRLGACSAVVVLIVITHCCTKAESVIARLQRKASSASSS
jgi:hypothetical protein